MSIENEVIKIKDLFFERRFLEVIESCERILEKDPKDANAMQIICLAHNNLGHAKEAREIADKTLSIRQDGEIYRQHGIILSNLGDLEGAYKDFLNAKKLGESPVDIGGFIATCLMYWGKYDEAVQVVKDVVKQYPTDPIAYWKVASLLREIGQTEESIDYYKKIIEVEPTLIRPQFDLGMLYLLVGEWDKGWPLLMKRWDEDNVRKYDSPYWRTEDLNDKTIVLWCDQGSGDYINFIRYAALIKDRYPKAKILFEESYNLVELLKLVKNLDSTYASYSHPLIKVKHDLNFSFFDTPYILKLKPESIPVEPYIKVTPIEIEDDNFKIGISFAGNKDYPHDFKRSVFLKQFKEIYDLPGVKLFNLTMDTFDYRVWPGKGAVKLADAPDMPNIDDPTKLFKHFGITASFMAGLDLVISVDTAVAHLAGAMGKPVWTLIPYSCDWRWGTKGDTTFWYPSMRLFRQDKPFDWSDPFQRIKTELQQLLKERNEKKSGRQTGL